MAEMVRIIEKNGLKGLALNGKTLVEPKFLHLFRNANFFIAPGRNGFIAFEVKKDQNGNEVAVVNITRNEDEYR